MPCEAFSLVVSLQVIATLDKKFALEYVEKNENVFWEQLKALLLLSLIRLPETACVAEEKKTVKPNFV